MNSVTIKRVKCGDSSTIKIDNKQLIIDCGSDNRGNGMPSGEFAYSSITEDLDNDYKTDLLITHFHKDHFNGVLHIPDLQKKLENIYLPYSIIREANVYSGAISKLLVIASPRSWGFRLSSNIINLLIMVQKVVSDPSHIRFVKAGDTINIANKTIHVLWPDCTFDIGSLKVLNTFIENIPTDMEDMKIQELTSEECAPTLRILDEHSKNEYNELLEYIRGQGYDIEEIESAQQLLNSSLEKYLDVFHNSKNLEKNYDHCMVQLQQAYTNSQQVNRKIWDYISKNESLMIHIKTFSRNQYHSLINTMNALSIVCDCEEQFIFLGDVPAEVIEHINRLFKTNYKIVKLQHHGTKDYYTSKTPNGEFYVVSNGGYVRRKVGKQFVSTVGKGKIICTNAHEDAEEYCSYYVLYGHCKETCDKLNEKKIIPIR